MIKDHSFKTKRALLCSAATLLAMASMGATGTAFAQDEVSEEDVIIITGTRIQNPDIVAASPITTVGIEELGRNISPNIERVFRDLPITIPGDGQNVNNGTNGRAEIDLRGLGPERSLVMIDGKRLNPHDIDGIVDINSIPKILLERVDIITGGASAVYGSDAMSGATNFILRKDFEGFEIDSGYSVTGPGGGDTYDISAIAGANFADGRGNVTVAGGYTNRGSVLLAQRDFGLFGVASATGAGAGAAPAEPVAECSGNTEFTTAFETGSGSTTSIPGTFDLGSGDSLQFNDDGTLRFGLTADNQIDDDRCARFNFNPFNYYQTPQTRWQAMATFDYEINDFVETYGRVGFAANRAAFQIAPSGTFGARFDIPFANPFLVGQPRSVIEQSLIEGAANNVAALTDLLSDPDPAIAQAAQDALDADPNQFVAVGINDNNGDGLLDDGDTFTSTIRRRTLELGPRTGIFDTDWFQFVWGVRGEIPWGLEGWNYDLSYQYGESDFVETRDGFTNLTNLEAGIETVDSATCTDVSGNVTSAPCTPINVFGPVGSITDAQRDSGFFTAVASDLRRATQSVLHFSTNGDVDGVQSPWASSPLAMAFGFEYRRESANSNPDECLKLQPASCQGGAGGFRAPVDGAYRTWEGFVEGIWPILEGRPYAEAVSIEAGYRYSTFDVQGTTDTWKAGISWEAIPGLRFRYMEQGATRVANVGELFSPVVTGLDNATFDPCSIGNENFPLNADETARVIPTSDPLFQRCIDTGVPIANVGGVDDIISGQVNTFEGTNPLALPDPETARTRTAGVIWQMDPNDVFGSDSFATTTFSLDYYNINISDYIDEPSGQEGLDFCYSFGIESACSGILRDNAGALTTSGNGVPILFQNFEFFRAEGLQLGINTGFDFGQFGEVSMAYNANYYLTNEFQTVAQADVVDCNGFYGTSCDPVPTYRHTMRTSWYLDAFDASILWRRVGGMEIQPNEASGIFEAFGSIDAQDYIDITAGFQINDTAYVSGAIVNAANKNPPIIGNETGSTEFNSGNTFPSIYDVLGRTYSIRLKLDF